MMAEGRFERFDDNPDAALVDQQQAEALQLIRENPKAFVLVVPDPEGTRLVAAGSTMFMAKAAVAAQHAAERMFVGDVIAAVRAREEEVDEDAA